MLMLLNQDRRTREKPTIHSVVIAISKVRTPRINWLVSDKSLSSLLALHPNTQVYICSPGRNRKPMEDGGRGIKSFTPGSRDRNEFGQSGTDPSSQKCCTLVKREAQWHCWCHDPTAPHLLSLHCTHFFYVQELIKPSSQVSYVSSEVPLQGEQQLHTTELKWHPKELPFSKSEPFGESH